MIGAKVIADSISSEGHRLTTMEIILPRCILPELLTHRAFSRNVASNRAIPTRKLIEQVRENPFVPIFGRNQPGMQNSEEPLSLPQKRELAEWWSAEAFNACDLAERLSAVGVHKQQINRLLEPFSYTTALVSATDWGNFLKQRMHPSAEPHMQVVASCVDGTLVSSEPVERTFHAPYVRPCDPKLVSIARCARVSYLNHGGTVDVMKDLELVRKLAFADPPHLSPFEHVAVARPGQHANFTGWSQCRSTFERYPDEFRSLIDRVIADYESNSD